MRPFASGEPARRKQTVMNRSRKGLKAYSFRCIGLLLLVAALFTVSPGPLQAYNLEERVQRTTLENGLRVLLVERHTSPTVSLYIRHLVGAADDGEGRTGAAHLLEHMLFKGTSTIGTKNFKEEERVLKKIRETGTALDRERMKG